MISTNISYYFTQKIHKELNEKVKLLEEESSNLKQSLAQKTECVNAVEEEVFETAFWTGLENKGMAMVTNLFLLF